MLVIFPVFHNAIFILKDNALQNIYDKSETVEGNWVGTEVRFTAPVNAPERLVSPIVPN